MRREVLVGVLALAWWPLPMAGCGGAGAGAGGKSGAPGATGTAPGGEDAASGRAAALAAALLDVECRDVVDARDTAGWAPDALVVRGRLPEPGPHDVVMELPDAVRAGLPLARLPPGGADGGPCHLGPPPPRPSGAGADRLAGFASGRFHLEVIDVSGGPSAGIADPDRVPGEGPGAGSDAGGAPAVWVTSRITIDYLGTRQRFGTRHRLRVASGSPEGGGAGEVPVTVLARRSWLERSGPSTVDGVGSATAYDAKYYASLDHGAERARARGDLGCAVARLAEARRFSELVVLLDGLGPEDRFPYWSFYVAAAEATGQFRKANDYRAWVRASVDDRAARRAAVGNLVDRCQRGTKGRPAGAATLASDGPCTDAESAALAQGTAPPELYCHPPAPKVEALARGFRGAVADCVSGGGYGDAEVGAAYEARLTLHQNGALDLVALGRADTPGRPASLVRGETLACAARAARELPRAPFRLRPAEGVRGMPTWEIQTEILVP